MFTCCGGNLMQAKWRNRSSRGGASHLSFPRTAKTHSHPVCQLLCFHLLLNTSFAFFVVCFFFFHFKIYFCVRNTGWQRERNICESGKFMKKKQWTLLLFLANPCLCLSYFQGEFFFSVRHRRMYMEVQIQYGEETSFLKTKHCTGQYMVAESVFLFVAFVNSISWRGAAENNITSMNSLWHCLNRITLHN